MGRTADNVHLSSSTRDVILRHSFNNIREFYQRYGPTTGSGYEPMDGNQRGRRVCGTGLLSFAESTFYRAMAGDSISVGVAREIENAVIRLGLKNQDGGVADDLLRAEICAYLVVLVRRLRTSFSANGLEDLLDVVEHYAELLTKDAPELDERDVARFARNVKARKKENRPASIIE